MRARRWLLPLLVASLAGQAGDAYSIDYYACDCGAGAEGGCTAGSDAAAGTSPATAWQTYDKLQDAVAASGCGDTFNFCKGGSFAIAGAGNFNEWSVSGQNCSANPKIARSYQPGTFANRPILGSSGPQAFNFGGYGHVNMSGFAIHGLNLLCTGACNNGVGTIFVNGADVEVDDTVVDGWSVGIQVGPQVPGFVLTDSIVKNNKSQGIIGQAGDRTRVEGSHFENNGCHGGTSNCTFEHAFYFNNVGAPDNTRLITVRNNTFVDNTMDIFNGGKCNGNVFTVRGGTGNIISGNTFLTNGDALGSCNVVRLSSTTTCTTGTTCEVCEGCLFSRNQVIGGNSLVEFESWIGGVLENNILYSPVSVESTAAKSALSHQPSGGNGPESVNVTVRNNTIVLGSSGSGGAPASAFDFRENAGSSSVYSNAVRMIGTNANDLCFRFFTAASLADVTEDYTFCHRDNVGVDWAAYGSGDKTLTQYQIDSANGDHSVDGDPGFVNPPSNFRLTSAAAGIDAGSPTESSHQDFRQSSRPLNDGYDVGAYEYHRCH